MIWKKQRGRFGLNPKGYTERERVEIEDGGANSQQYSCLGGEKRLAKEKTSLYNKASKNHKEVLKCKRIIAHKTKKLNGSQSTH